MADPFGSHLLIDAQATSELGRAIAEQLRGGDCITLEGALGAGKTSLVKGIALGLGIDPSVVTSPTFVNLQTYVGGRLVLHHIDCWRMRTVGELDSIGWDELMQDRSAAVAIEWPSRIGPAIPRSQIRVNISIEPDPVQGAAATRRRALVEDMRQGR